MRIDSDILQNCWFLAGPTACGKTAAAVCLAQRIGAEIVAMDSMSLYRGMDIGTAKPTAAEQSSVRHHLIDILDPSEEYSVADYLSAANSACRDILDRGRVPLFVGGTGLYLRALLRGVFEGPSADWTYRESLNALLQRDGEQALHGRLREVDATSAARLHPHDVRRVIRALEVHHVTGRPASQLQTQSPLPVGERPQNVYWLEPPRDWLHERINARVHQMIALGLVDEVQRLLNDQQPISRTARQALGYAQVIECLSGGITLDVAIAQIQTATRQFAKRQHTWFRNMAECRAIRIAGIETAEQIAVRILSFAGIGQ